MRNGLIQDHIWCPHIGRGRWTKDGGAVRCRCSGLCKWASGAFVTHYDYGQNMNMNMNMNQQQQRTAPRSHL